MPFELNIHPESLCDMTDQPNPMPEKSSDKALEIEDEQNKPPRVQQASLLVTKLNFDIQYQIFEQLGPASQRLFGATCSTFRDIQQEGFPQSQIDVHLSEIPVGLDGTSAYVHILAAWLGGKAFLADWKDITGLFNHPPGHYLRLAINDIAGFSYIARYLCDDYRAMNANRPGEAPRMVRAYSHGGPGSVLVDHTEVAKKVDEKK
ncbi:uncharacterized protein LY89DRAFT_733743 [Mollisia scopiformis]|uniref:Uncharacterized protein n=1 Tax=Mollisia scopiformis TaxID=149040 RepID=A0A194XAF0_MOLSC|nr:uncharacterized protein LY89DRAFT_733743 [Mollisia scopiformis]KUJ16737.1 hypothetical protein LY89DRAFT_733743 [Mollisia scopiformis]